MKYFTLFVGLCALVAVVVWAYNMNYRTRQVFNRLDALRAEIAAEGEAIQVLRVEWAWLNSPERLKKLVTVYREDLKLTYLQGDHFSHAESVPFPPRLETALHPEVPRLAPETSTAASGTSPFPPPTPRPQSGMAALDVLWRGQ